MATWPHGPAQVRCQVPPAVAAASLKSVSPADSASPRLGAGSALLPPSACGRAGGLRRP